MDPIELRTIYHREKAAFATEAGRMAILACEPLEPEEVPGGARSLSGRTKLVSGIEVKALVDEGELVSPLSYRFYGRWKKHPRYGWQFVAEHWFPDRPHGRAGVIRYLMLAPHVGQMTAAELWRKFGSDAVRVLRTQPEVAAAAVPGGRFTSTKAREASAYLGDQQRIEDCRIDLMDVLDGVGVPRDTHRRLLSQYGNRAAEIVRRNPYVMMDLPGVGFLTCHNLYRDLGGNTTRKKCQALAAWYTMHASGAGHTWFAPALVANGINELVSTSIPDPLPALRLAKRARRIAVRRDEMGTPWLADYHHDQQEGAIAQRVARMLDDDGDWPEIDRLDASPHQRQQAANAMARGRIGILTGGPGTGKTRTTARLVAAMEDRWGSGQVACCAPTGKAAVRLSEVMDGYGVGVRARTIHSLLGVTAHAEGGGWSFEHGPGKPLPFRAIVLDEGSMPDVPIMASLLEAMPQGAHLLMVGDTGQLPPVGHGKPMDDLIRAGVGYGELTETFRNGGTIVEACRRIGLGQPFLVDKELDPPSGKNLYHLHASEERVDEVLWSSIQRLARAGVVEPVMGLQVITAVNEKTPCSRQRLNEFLQGTINPDGARAAGTSFRQHDKVVCLKNGFIKQDDQSETFVANGEQGRVVGVDAGTITVALTAPTRVIRVRGEALRRWDLAYAISCHKAQGSEWPVVIVVLDPSYGARMVTSREWLRTAISRAKTACLLVGSLDVARRMVQREVISRRKTFLPERIAACREDLVDVAAPARSPAMAL